MLVFDEATSGNKMNVNIDNFFIVGLEGKIEMAFKPKGSDATDPTTLAAMHAFEILKHLDSVQLGNYCCSYKLGALMADNIKYGTHSDGEPLVAAMIEHPTLSEFGKTLLDVRGVAAATNYVTTESKNPLYFGEFISALKF